ncbi:MAG: hypothetical protein C0598_14380 [Marinilabiliales bacterium]|nr:MAG: hypothetical protein C0598_14380 [Marinilabiliales bacterium]
MIIKIIEALRIAGTAFGVFWAYYVGETPQEILNVMTPWVVVSIAGTSGLEGLFFGRQAAIEKGYEQGSNYQTQSAIALLSYGVIALVVYFLKWGTNAELTIVLVFMFFTIFSGVNHARSVIQDKNYKWANLNRPFLAVLLTAVLWYPVVGSF